MLENVHSPSRSEGPSLPPPHYVQQEWSPQRDNTYGFRPFPQVSQVHLYEITLIFNIQLIFTYTQLEVANLLHNVTMFHSDCLKFVVLLNNKNKQQTLQIGEPGSPFSRSLINYWVIYRESNKIGKVGNSAMQFRNLFGKDEHRINRKCQNALGF